MEAIDNKKVIYEFGEFVLDPEERTLFISGTPIHLPAKEFNTLLLLVEHNGRVLSKEEMISAIWEDSFVEEGNLAKQISRLRKVINTNGEAYIETVPKHGYRFKADLHRELVDPAQPVVLEKHTVKRVRIAVEEQTDEHTDEPLALPAAPRRSLINRTLILISTVLIIAVAGTIFWFWRAERPAGEITSVAVLPLQSIGSDEDGQALGLGLTDELITKIGSLRRIVVRPISSVTATTAATDPIETGRNLNVDAVLVGTIQRADGRLRVNARLLRIANGEQIWGDRFEEPSGAIFALQDALSGEIVKALAFQLDKSDKEILAHRGTENADAYEAYLRGRFYQSKNSGDGLKRSIELYQQAVALDPNFADAYAGIADAYIVSYNFELLSADQAIPVARDAVSRALMLNPNLTDAYTSLALIQFLADKNWHEAELSLQHAIELNPNDVDAYLRYGYFLINVGRFDDALEKLEKAHQLNPLSSIVNSDIGMAYVCSRRYPQAISQLEKTAAEDTQFSLPQWLLSTAYESVGDREKSFAAGLKAVEIEGDKELADQLRDVHDKQGLDAANRFWLQQSIKTRLDQPAKIGPSFIAIRAATVQDREQTLYWLEKAFDEGDQTLMSLKFLEKFDFVRDDPRFQAMAKKLEY